MNNIKFFSPNSSVKHVFFLILKKNIKNKNYLWILLERLGKHCPKNKTTKLKKKLYNKEKLILFHINIIFNP